MKFVAIDFETTDRDPSGACAFAMAVVENGKVAAVEHRLIRPPASNFEFFWLHGINWPQVSRKLPFGPVWDELMPLTKGATCLVGHNAPFDRRGLAACCRAADRLIPRLPFVCTVRWAREAWELPDEVAEPVRLSRGIPLDHHNAGFAALACARIAAMALRKGSELRRAVVTQDKWARND